jgi:opacity protein-like surface antigen
MRSLQIKILFGGWVIYSVLNAAQAQNNDQIAATAKSFEGFAIQAALGYQPYTINATNIKVGNANFKLPDQNYTGNSTPYFAGFSYTAALTDRATIGAQLEINPANQQYVLSLLPGYAFTPSTQAYLKLAWVSALVTVDQQASQSKVSANGTGATAGLGVKQLWTQNWYGFVEANYVKMNTFKFDTTTNNLPITGNAAYSGYNVMVGIGYKF